MQAKSSIQNNALGAGFIYRRIHYITHSWLNPDLSAVQTFAPWQLSILLFLIGVLIFGFIINIKITLIVGISILSVIYLLDVIFNFFVTLHSLHFAPLIEVSPTDLAALKDYELPRYTILCPLYREVTVLPQFVQAMQAMDWPQDKLEIILLLEEDDKQTLRAARAKKLPSNFRLLIVPDGRPKTKPKACNYGLAQATGEFVVIYDAEDIPDPAQLKIAYLGFLRSVPEVICLQAKLNYYNHAQSLLTRLFTAEYSLWFDIILPGLQSLHTTIPLGGTSNHFRTEKLKKLHGWDAFNVTEDCDLGARLFSAGYQTAIIGSTTLEEANSHIGNWLRQRSRWLKGYMQTYLVHTRHPLKLIREQGWHSFLFQLIVGGKISFILINPVLWLMTIGYFVFHQYVGSFIESIYPSIVFYIAVTSLVIGNFLALYTYMIGCAQKKQWYLLKYIFLIPLYWLLISVAALIALFQLIFKPHHWEKTTHGLHLTSSVLSASTPSPASAISKLLSGSSVMVAATLIGSIFNFLYNLLLSRYLSLTNFGEISLFGSFLYIASVPISALGRSVTHRSAYLLGKYGHPVAGLWYSLRPNLARYALIISLIWLAATPAFMLFFHVDSYLPFLLFSPVWLIATLFSFDNGFLSGNLFFTLIAVILVIESVVKLVLSYIFIQVGLSHYVYAATPLSMLVSLGLAWLNIKRLTRSPVTTPIVPDEDLVLSRSFIFSSMISIFGNATYLSLDLMLAKHYLSSLEAGIYSYLSLAGKMVYLLGGLFGQFLIPYLSHELGTGKDGRSALRNLIALVVGSSTFTLAIFGFMGSFTAPLLWGETGRLIVPYLPAYTIAMSLFCVVNLLITYEQVRGRHLFAFLTLVAGTLQIVGMVFFHAQISDLVMILLVTSLISLSGTLLLMRYYDHLLDFVLPMPSSTPQRAASLRILIFNWRDLRHKWAGGAETYLHELSRRWVKAGHQVTIFCGNDGSSPRVEVSNGINIIRQGGFYLVYIWAFLYYIFRLKGNYDVIVDSENGLPFFTPLYVQERVYLLIHHVHQEVFRKSLIPPLSTLALFLEAYLMPRVYRHTQVITVSPSSKAEILFHQMTDNSPQIIYNGVDLSRYRPGRKARAPTVLYLGRLTTAKSLDILIRAITHLMHSIPDLKVIIAGDGPSLPSLRRLVGDLHLDKIIRFTGKVSERVKIGLYQKAWVFVNPSLIEGWGITTIEANACGTPVIASNVAGLRDAVHNPHSGLLVPYGDTVAFAEAMTYLLSHDSTRRRMSEESVSWAREFDWDKSALSGLNILKGKYV